MNIAFTKTKFFWILLASFVVLVGACYWAPWITDAYAKQRATEQVNYDSPSGAVMSGCYLDHVVSSYHVAFGRKVTVSLVCMSMSPRDLLKDPLNAYAKNKYFRQQEEFVSFSSPFVSLPDKIQ